MKMFDPTVRVRTVFVQDMPQCLADALPSPDEMMILMHGHWRTEVLNNKDEPDTYVSRFTNWGQDDIPCDPPMPEVFRFIKDVASGHSYSGFYGCGAGDNGALNWHIDDYHVWAFNLEGVTEWQWFDIYEGKIKSQIIEPYKQVITMPSGVTHRVRLVEGTEERVSVSLIQGDHNIPQLMYQDFTPSDEQCRNVHIDNLNFWDV